MRKPDIEQQEQYHYLGHLKRGDGSIVGRFADRTALGDDGMDSVIKAASAATSRPDSFNLAARGGVHLWTPEQVAERREKLENAKGRDFSKTIAELDRGAASMAEARNGGLHATASAPQPQRRSG